MHSFFFWSLIRGECLMCENEDVEREVLKSDCHILSTCLLPCFVLSCPLYIFWVIWGSQGTPLNELPPGTLWDHLVPSSCLVRIGTWTLCFSALSPTAWATTVHFSSFNQRKNQRNQTKITSCECPTESIHYLKCQDDAGKLYNKKDYK